MKHFLIAGALLGLGGCAATDNELEDKEQVIELQYVAWACDCANWATQADIAKYHDNIGDTLADRSIFVEPENASLKLPDTIGYNSDLIKFTGRFYKRKGFPKGFKSGEQPDKARVFRYTAYTVLESNYRQALRAEGK